MTNVLVVEDQPQVRAFIERLLTADGYAVRVASNGEEALEAVLAGAAVDLLVTDLVMPRISGRDLVVRLRRSSDIKVLYVSGYVDAPEALHVSPETGTAFLRKPFSRGDLLAAIHALAPPGGAPPQGKGPVVGS